jgi:hypothetical protein
MTTKTAGQLVQGLLFIFKQPATATPAEGEDVQEVGLHVAGSISHAQHRLLLTLSEQTQTEFTTQADEAGLRLTFTTAPPASAAAGVNSAGLLHAQG